MPILASNSLSTPTEPQSNLLFLMEIRPNFFASVQLLKPLMDIGRTRSYIEYLINFF